MDQNPANMEHQDDASENLNQGNEMENVNEAPSNEENTVEETVEQVEAAVEIAEVVEEPAKEVIEEPVVAEAPSEVHEEEEHLNQLPVEEIEEVEAEVEPDEDFSQLSKQELLEKMETYSKHDKVNAVKNRVNAARDVFQGIVQQEKSVALAKFLEEGGVKEEFDYQDQIEIKFFDAYKHYQKRRSEFVLGQEKNSSGKS